MSYEEIMNLIELIAEGESSLCEIVNCDGIIVPEITVLDSEFDENGEIIDVENIEYDWKNARADRKRFTEKECREIDTALHDACETVEEWYSFNSECNAYYSDTRGV